MRALVLLVLVGGSGLVGGCELDVAPPKPSRPTPHVVHIEADPASQYKQLDVLVREYGTEVPIGNARVELEQNRPCTGEAQVCLPARKSAVTASDGTVSLKLKLPQWSIARISAPGYLTTCPVPSDDEFRQSFESEPRFNADEPVYGVSLIDGRKYVCHLVPPSAMVVRDRAQAKQLARAEPEIAYWLRKHPDARTTQVELVGIRWYVRFETPAPSPRPSGDATGDDSYGEMRLVLVDGVDKTASVIGR